MKTLQHISLALLVGFLLTSCSFYFSDEYNRDYRVFYVEVSANDSTLGQVTGSGLYDVGTVVNIVAVANQQGVFKEWSDGNTEQVRTFKIDENIVLTAFFEAKPGENHEPIYVENGYEYIDLGLPSGRLWAVHNIGATQPEGVGTFFAWGETESKEIYDWSTYLWCNGSFDSLIKYCSDAAYGTVDNKKMLDLEDDAARANWGGRWRIPNRQDMQELFRECTWIWTTINNVRGYLVTGPNANTIFFPAVPAINKEDQNNWAGDYMLNELYIVPNAGHAFNFYFYDLEYVIGSIPRCSGQNIRPVIGGL